MTDTTISASVGTFSARRFIGTLHLWMGLTFGIPAAILGVTGTIEMVVHPLPATITQDYVTGSIDALATTARVAAPPGAILQQYTAPVTASEPPLVRFGVPSTESARGFINIEVDSSANARRQPERSAWRTVVHDLHVNFMGGATGKWLVGIVGAIMTVLAISGVVIWWPRAGQWLNAFIVTGRGGALRVFRELHGAAGIWGLIVFAVVSVTGVVIVFPATTAGGPPPPARGANAPQPAAVGLATYQADAAIALAKEAVPRTVLRGITFPSRAGEAYQVRLSGIGDDRFAPPTTVIVDHEVSKVTEVRAPVATTSTLRSFSRQLHTGRAGWVWWILVTVSGILPVGFVISGTAMWLLKRRNRARVG